jgi:uncharacterized protein YjbI with pentapeptide repeats
MFELPASGILSVAKDWIPKLIAKLSALRAERNAELEALYSEFGDPTELLSVYVEPDCQHFNPSDFEEEEDLDLVRQPVFSRLTQFFTGPPRARNTRLLVLADAGVGKTSLLIMTRIAHLAGLWTHIPHCVLLKLGPDVIERASAIPNKTQTILLLDALDEDPSAWGRVDTRLIELLSTTSVFNRVVITCRTQFFEGDKDPFHNRGRVQLGGYIFPLIYLSLFTRDQVAEYLSKRFPTRDDAQTKAISIVDRMKSLQCRPMLLAHIEDLLDSDVNFWTEFALYEALVTAWLMRECAKLSTRARTPPTVQELWHACRDVAIALHRSGQYTISAPELDQLIRNNSDIGHMYSFDIKGRSLLNRNTKGHFRFAHRSIAEFLIADGIVKQRLHDAARLRPTDQLMQFIVSWMSIRDAASRRLLPLKALDLSDMDLRERDLAHTDLADVALSEARLSRTDFTGADLSRAEFRNANAVGLRLERSALSGTDFTGARLNSAILTKAHGSGTVFMKAEMSNCLADHVSLEAAAFDGSSLVGADFNGAALPNISALDARLTSASFAGAVLTGGRFDKADARLINLTRASAQQAVFDHAVLAGANFSNADLAGARLQYADLTGANLTGAVLEGADLRHALLDDCDFSEAKLSGANLQYCRCRNVNWKNADLTNANLEYGGFDRRALRAANTAGARLP